MKLRLVAGALGAALIVSACSAEDPTPQRAEPAPATTSTSPTPTPTPTPTPPARSLLSGRLGKPNGPVMAVKIDNTGKAHPQVGLSAADVVYIEQVEGGVTRLAAVYSSQLPPKVGPVRSARITDIELLKQYGTVKLVYSGSQRKLADNLRRARLRLVAYDTSSRGFSRGGWRPKPYDVIGDVSTLSKRGGTASRPKRVGYSFGAVPAGGKRASHVTVWYPGARVDADWSPRARRWRLSMDGRPDKDASGRRLGPTTFIVQFATVRRSVYHDVNGANTPMTETVGAGKALIFRDGKVFAGRWVRKKPWHPTAYVMRGKRAVFAPGQLWVALLARDRPVRVR